MTARDDDEARTMAEEEVVLSDAQIVLSTLPKDDDADVVVLRTTPEDSTDVVILTTTGTTTGTEDRKR